MFIFNYLIPLRESKNEAGGSSGGWWEGYSLALRGTFLLSGVGELQSQSEPFVD